MLENVPENEDLDRLLDAAEALSDMQLCAICTDGSEADMSDTRVAQPLLYLTDWAWGVALVESGVQPVAVAGHSLGELAALAIAGVYSVEAGLELVVERSRLMSSVARKHPGAMSAVIGMDRPQIEDALAGLQDVWIANDNAPGQVVISGLRDSVTEAAEKLAAAGARRVVPLPVSGAFHSPLMEEAREAFANILVEADFADAALPVYQNTNPEATTDAETIRRRLVGQISEPVRWTETMRAMQADGVSLLVEAGPGAVLSGLAKRVEGLNAVSAEQSGIERVLEEVS
jgi:[acyl-carrier-protein] S-malonyltransferase